MSKYSLNFDSVSNTNVNSPKLDHSLNFEVENSKFFISPRKSMFCNRTSSPIKALKPSNTMEEPKQLQFEKLIIKFNSNTSENDLSDSVNLQANPEERKGPELIRKKQNSLTTNIYKNVLKKALLLKE